MKSLVGMVLLCLPLWAHAAGVSIDLDDKHALQKGAETYAHYCQSCHSLKHMRYSRIGKDLEMTDAELESRLILGDGKVTDSMLTSMDTDDAIAWFVGAKPPDLSLVARSRGADWLYDYLNGFYQDESRPFGVNNMAFKDVGMPNVLGNLQGKMKVNMIEVEGRQEFSHVKQIEPGTLSSREFDKTVTDLVNFMVYAGEPSQMERKSLGKYVILYLFLFFWVARLLKKEYWKDID